MKTVAWFARTAVFTISRFVGCAAPVGAGTQRNVARGPFAWLADRLNVSVMGWPAANAPCAMSAYCPGGVGRIGHAATRAARIELYPRARASDTAALSTWNERGSK